MRSWQQVWDPNAEFVFNKNLKGMLDREQVLPGDLVTPEMRKHLGTGGLLAFWKSGAIAIKDGPGSPPVRHEAPVAPVEAPVAPSFGLPKRKRGRPSKADIAAREAALKAQTQ